MMYVHRLSAEQGVRKAKSFRSIIDPYGSLMQCLRVLEQDLGTAEEDDEEGGEDRVPLRYLALAKVGVPFHAIAMKMETEGCGQPWRLAALEAATIKTSRASGDSTTSGKRVEKETESGDVCDAMTAAMDAAGW